MATVIVGGGIIGCATAYYLSEIVSDPSSIHIIEASPILFAGASGYAGGFLAKDWFATPSASLGTLSFRLHKQLSDQYEGDRRWGYLPSSALSLGIDEGVGVGGSRGEDWLLQGTSRANAATQGDFLEPDGSPAWLTKQKGGTVEVISSDGGCAQVDPHQLCHFLLSECQKRGVQLHQPARATSISTKSGSDTIDSITITRTAEGQTYSELQVPLKSLILTSGPWTPSVFASLFPSSKYRVPISSLAGHSLLIRSPRHKAPFTSITETDTSRNRSVPSISHAIFCAPSPISATPFAPELFSRAAGEIYIAGLNSSSKPLPADASEKPIDDDAVDKLKTAAVKLLGHAPGAPYQEDGEALAEHDLTIEKVGLCWRPVTSTGTPLIGRLPDKKLGTGIRPVEGGGIYVAAGHGPWGISLSLGTGKVVAEMVEEKQRLSADVDKLGLY